MKEVRTMPERTSYAQGTPSWVDLSSPDVEASEAFYGALFGWDSDGATEAPEDSGGYEIFTLHGKRVAGIGPLMAPDQPIVWSTYLAVDDADEVAGKAVAAGGRLVIEPMDVLQAGRMAGFVDTSGAFVGVWQAREHIGAEVVNEPGAVGWNDLMTRDTAAAEAFYPAVFGIEAAPWENAGSQYTVWNVDGRTVGGLVQMDENSPAEVPPHWMTYFIVEDADATAAMTEMLGGSIRVEPFDVPNIGRIGVLADPHGAVFSIMTAVGPADA
jgi:predicted enzyme related to lactoylglutathione lyase